MQSLPDDKILDKLKQSAEDNFRFDENSRKFSKLVENTVGKGEIARYFSHSVFKRLVSQGRQKVSLCGNGLISFYALLGYTFTCRTQCINILQHGAGKQHFLLFLRCFLPF